MGGAAGDFVTFGGMRDFDLCVSGTGCVLCAAARSVGLVYVEWYTTGVAEGVFFLKALSLLMSIKS